MSEAGQNNIRILRNWAKSKGWHVGTEKGRPEIWGAMQGEKFSWKLKIKPEASSRPGLAQGSNVPRFDAKLADGKYINPFTGEMGGESIGTHLLLDMQY